MKPSRCNYCGSYRLLADRALGGKLICRDCGKPISNIKRLRPKSRRSNIKRLIIISLISLFVFIIFF